MLYSATGALHIGFAGILAEMNVACGNAEIFRDRIEFVGGVGQLRQRLRQPRAIDAGPFQKSV